VVAQTNRVVEGLLDPRRASAVGAELQFVERLRQSIIRADSKMDKFRRQQKAGVQRYVGALYGDSPMKARPMNQMYLAVATLVPLLVNQNPKNWVRTRSGELRPFCTDFELALNHLDKEIDFAATLLEGVVASMFGPAIFRTGLCPTGNEYPVGGYMHDPGQVFCDYISLADYVVDPDAKKREQAMFEGHYYELPTDFVRRSGMFENVGSLDMGGTPKQMGTQDTRELSGKVSQERVVDMTTLIDLWIPPSNPWGGQVGVIITLEGSSYNNTPVRVVEWDGPEEGPFDILGYHPVPDNIIDLPPSYVWQALDDLLNAMARKTKRQADRQKTVVTYDGAAEEDAKSVQNAFDGEMVKVHNVDRLREINLGGVNENSYAYQQGLRQDFSRLAGNLDQLGGIGSDAATATEFAGIQANADVRINYMAGRVENLVRSIQRKKAWFLWNDPMMDQELAKATSDPNIVVMTRFSADRDEGDFLDYNIDIQPYSLRADTPDTYVRKLLGWLNGVVLPTMQIGAMQGAMLNVPVLAKLTGKAMQIMEIDDLYITMEPSGLEQQGAATPRQTSAQTPGRQAPRLTAGGGGRTKTQPQVRQNPTGVTGNAKAKPG